MDILGWNRKAWDQQVEEGNRWTIPVTSQEIADARQGRWKVLLTPTKAVPDDWFPEMAGLKVLCLASGGGQQGPLFASAGARVTVYDNSPRQLAQDRMVAEREGLELATVEGDMADLSQFADSSFDLVFHPVSNIFAPAVRPVWREAFRVLRPGGALLAGFVNPVQYIFDLDRMEQEGIFEVKYSIPYSDLESLPQDKLQNQIARGWPLEFCHSLDDQIGGQLKAGFVLTGFYEDSDPDLPLSKFIPTYIATRAVRPS